MTVGPGGSDGRGESPLGGAPEERAGRGFHTASETRATAAAASADDYGWYPQCAEALLRGPGLIDDELIDLSHSVGITDEGLGEAVHAGRYLPWPNWITEYAMRWRVSRIPSVYVAGRPLGARPGPIMRAVSAAFALRVQRHSADNHDGADADPGEDYMTQPVPSTRVFEVIGLDLEEALAVLAGVRGCPYRPPERWRGASLPRRAPSSAWA